MAVLLQEGINSESSGVMITTDPFDPENTGAIYISAKRGLGIKVVEGRRIAEQLIFRPRTNAIRVLTRSEEDSLLTFDENGGLKEVAITGDRVVLTDDVIRRLVRAAAAINRLDRNRDEDIEWAYMKVQIYILQSRPFIVNPV
jgi:phosphoenolpyruvate synthase/pyruvate phosphate dikinase